MKAQKLYCEAFNAELYLNEEDHRMIYISTTEDDAHLGLGTIMYDLMDAVNAMKDTEGIESVFDYVHEHTFVCNDAVQFTPCETSPLKELGFSCAVVFPTTNVDYGHPAGWISSVGITKNGVLVADVWFDANTHAKYLMRKASCQFTYDPVEEE